MINSSFFKKLTLTTMSVFLLASGIESAHAAGNETKKNPPINPQYLDNSVKPGQDFFQYANGTWMKNNPIPDEYSRYGSFETLQEDNYNALKGIMEDAKTKRNDKKNKNIHDIGNFYFTGMDTNTIEALGARPLRVEIDRIDDLKNITDFQTEVAHLHTIGINPLFYIYAGQDEKNSSWVIANLMQGGLGLPDRDYYLGKDNRSKEIRDEYVKHLTKTFEMLGDKPEQAAKNAEIVMKIETRLAEASYTRLEMRNPEKNYNKMRLGDLQKLSTGFDWGTYFRNIGLPEPGDINVGQTPFFKEIGKIIDQVSLPDWKEYLRWNLIRNTAYYLSSDFVNEHFKFYGTVLSGKKALQPRWKRVLNATNEALGEAVGQLYVEKYFPAKAKTRMLELVNNLKDAMGDRIRNLEWMSPATKEKALEKLARINVKIGYPDKWIDYTNMDIRDDSYLMNSIRAANFNFNYDISKINKPVDRTKWDMTPQTVNAYYSPNMNEIVFPAAILQYPFFMMDADDAVNYGAIGVVIGHEMTHGFDDQGRLYDKDGNLQDWWTEDDAKKFNERTDILVKQYDAFNAIDTMHVNGKLTLGENIADVGGLNIAFTALQKAMKKNPPQAQIDGFTPEQRFFLAYAQVWRGNIRDKELMKRIKEDVHSPGKFRVNGGVVNLEEFFKAFNIQPGDPLYRSESDRAKIW